MSSFQSPWADMMASGEQKNKQAMPMRQPTNIDPATSTAGSQKVKTLAMGPTPGVKLQPANPEQRASQMWANMMADYDASLGGKMQQTYADEGRAGRQADAIAARLGQGVSGGGYQAGQAQVVLGGMAQRQDVLNQHTKQGLEMKMAYLDTLIRRAEAAKDRRLQEKLQAEADKTLLALQGSNIDTTDYASSSGGSGGVPVSSFRYDPNAKPTNDDILRALNDPDNLRRSRPYG